jgi:hypothetical protein
MKGKRRLSETPSSKTSPLCVSLKETMDEGKEVSMQYHVDQSIEKDLLLEVKTQNLNNLE